MADSVLQYLTREPDPATEVTLVVEVSVTTLAGDTNIKPRLYARAGIPEYWVVDAAGRRLLVYRDPGPDGYAEQTVYAADEQAGPLMAPDSLVRLADLLP